MKHPSFPGHEFPDGEISATWFDVGVMAAVFAAHACLLAYMLFAN